MRDPAGVVATIGADVTIDPLHTDLYSRLAAGEFSSEAIVESLAGCLDADQETCINLAGALLSVTLGADTAQRALRELVEHHRLLSEKLGSTLDIRVTAMDYATRHPEIVREPVLVDYQVLALSQRLAAVDGLTGLFNRRFLDIYLSKELNRARRHRETFSVLFVDLDDFKQINDQHGHGVGDQVLATVAREIQALLRQEDFAARYGGEEFLVVLPHTGEEGAARFAERLTERLAAVELPHSLAVAYSGGIATFPVHGSTARDLLHLADTALYEAKINGKAHVRVAPSEKRSAPRLEAGGRARCYLDDRELGDVRLYDVSLVGMSALAGVRFAPGQTVRFRILVDETESSTEQIEVLAKIVWDRKIRESEYRFGGQWATDDPQVVHTLVEHVAAR